MTIAAETTVPPVNDAEPAPKNAPRPNGMTDEQVRYTRAALGRRKNDPGYLQRGEEGIAEYRRMIQEELERELAEEGK